MYTHQTIPIDPSLPPAPDLRALYPGYYCSCVHPLPIKSSEREGTPVAYCARCEREVND